MVFIVVYAKALAIGKRMNVWAIFRVLLQMLKTMRLRIAPVNQ
jgi:hypothetical protein